MRKWGIIVTCVYALVVPLLFTVGISLFSVGDVAEVALLAVYFSVWILLLVLCQATLLLVTVDRSNKQLKPRRHVGISIASVAAALAMLTTGAVFALWAAITGDDAVMTFFEVPVEVLGKLIGKSDALEVIVVGPIFVLPLVILWGPWALVFRRFYKHQSSQLFRWLYAGSVLELLIVVPCHIVVRSRDDCSAPLFSSFGIATGLSIMLLAFGPSVIYLYRKQLERYRRPMKETD